MTKYTRRQMLVRMSAAGAGAMTLPAILAACGGDDSESSGASGGSGSTTDFTMQAAWINDAEFMGYFIAMDKGYYAEQGLKLQRHEEVRYLSLISRNRSCRYSSARMGGSGSGLPGPTQEGRAAMGKSGLKCRKNGIE